MFTPGPWTVEQDDAFQGMPFIPISAPSGEYGEKRICEVAPELLDDGTFAITDETRANARLIVAVQDLLDACELVIGSLSFDREDPFSREVIRRLSAAIAKAKGA